MSDFLYAVEREFDIPGEVLWDAWTDATALEAWYHPVGMPCVPGSVESDVVAGGVWAVAVDSSDFGFVSYFFGRYTEIDDQKFLEHTMHYTQSAEEFAARDFTTEHHRVQVEFQSRGMRSWVKFSQFGHGMSDHDVLEAQNGMESYFDSLEAFLAAGTPTGAE